MSEQDVRVLDEQLLAEIDLMTELMATATAFDQALCEHIIDAVLRLPTGSAPATRACACGQEVRRAAAPAAPVPSPRQGP